MVVVVVVVEAKLRNYCLAILPRRRIEVSVARERPKGSAIASTQSCRMVDVLQSHLTRLWRSNLLLCHRVVRHHFGSEPLFRLKDPVEKYTLAVETISVGEALTLCVLSGLIFSHVSPPLTYR